MFKPSGYHSSSLVRQDPPSPQERGGPVVFATCLQFPPPERPEYPPSTLEQFGMLFLAVLLLFALVLLALPSKWSRKVIRVAFCIGKNRQ